MNVSAFLAGLIFGFGLLLSGMTDPARVRGFFDLFGAWDVSLAFVMGGAVLTALPAFVWARRQPLYPVAEHLQVLAAKPVDVPLVLGAVLFGIGWGLSGLCPGPALVVAASGNHQALVFVAALAAGSIISRRLLQPALSRP